MKNAAQLLTVRYCVSGCYTVRGPTGYALGVVFFNGKQWVATIVQTEYTQAMMSELYAVLDSLNSHGDIPASYKVAEA